MTTKMQDKINRLVVSGAHILKVSERRSLVVAGYAEWRDEPTPDHPTRKILHRTDKCPEPNFEQ